MRDALDKQISDIQTEILEVKEGTYRVQHEIHLFDTLLAEQKETRQNYDSEIASLTPQNVPTKSTPKLTKRKSKKTEKAQKAPVKIPQDLDDSFENLNRSKDQKPPKLSTSGRERFETSFESEKQQASQLYSTSPRE